MSNNAAQVKRRVTIKIRRRRFEEDDAWLEPEERLEPKYKWVIEWMTYYVVDSDYQKAGVFAGGVDDYAESYKEAWEIADGMIRNTLHKGWEIGHE